MSLGLSDQVREVAKVKYVQPAIHAGKRQFAIPVKELLMDLQAQGFPARNTPQVCTALQTKKFLRENGLEIEGVDGPPSKLSTTVVVRYRVEGQGVKMSASRHGEVAIAETNEEKARRLAATLLGLYKDDFAEFGGGEAFLKWVRSEDEDVA